MKPIAIWEADGKRLTIRRLKAEREYRDIEEVQRVAWDFEDLDVVPMAHMIAAEWAGGMVLGAFDDDQLIGFSYGFPAVEQGELHGHVEAALHSHMLAVRPEARNLGAGVRLKLAQRDEALTRGFKEITWTFDPLQSLNAHLNFSRLGVICHRYIENFYGEETSSPLHRGVGTDRLWVRWLITSDRVRERLESSDKNPSSTGNSASPVIASEIPASSNPRCALFLRQDDNWVPGDEVTSTSTNSSTNSGGHNDSNESREVFFGVTAEASDDIPPGWRPYTKDQSRYHIPEDGLRCLIEIPDGIQSIKRDQPDLAIEWRDSIQSAFLSALSHRFTAMDFHKVDTPDGRRWFYVLERPRYFPMVSVVVQGGGDRAASSNDFDDGSQDNTQ